MQNRKRRIGIVLCLACVLLFSGCGKDKKEDTAKVVYEYGDATITYGEYYIYARTVQEDYQKAYGSGVWSLELETDEGKSSIKEVTIQDLIADINRVKVLVSRAENLKVTLSDKEKAEAEDTAATFYEGLTDKDIKQAEITKELVVQVMEENMLAKKVYDQVISENDFEISDEEARMTTFYDMVFECYSVNKDGSIKEYTDEKKAAQLERANEALSSLAQDEEMTYDMIVDKFDLEYSAEYTMSRTEMIEEYGESVASKLLELSDGEVSVVVQSEYGYHIFKMLQSNDEELTKKNKAAIVEQKQKEYFNSVYQEWAKKYDSHFNVEEDVDKELLNKFPFSDN